MQKMWDVALFEPFMRKNKDVAWHIMQPNRTEFVFLFFFLDLQESISRIHRTIELMYFDKTMIQVSMFSVSDE